MEDADFGVVPGASVRFSKTVSESDVYLTAGLTGDFSSAHINEEYMRRSAFGRRIAHGILVVGFMSTASSMMFNPHLERYGNLAPVSLGYDRIRFLKPVFFGDTVTVNYTVEKLDGPRWRCYSDINVINQHRDVIAVAKHIITWVETVG
ncbi:MaoC/PaaZ C-terminal domain-containing protein [Bradyrhizobium sp. CB82]|uniref:MaoC/PaaZ C-terminal domain-containing protein n=1 Tax=Bradyrhizobium sp. CB82 TaxID=3039159 RepID=UPI0024B1E6E7|nr:MaoC/PaaZ C-terminal domain-containing protein [Bradyrhizobium sp. CB82]WFU41522.1 MaoC/PaaZ C-terminal domain-containing protein [Bradyrhizobium sp. CB82]